ncbi:hypothetical protein DPD44_23470 [Salmonella enterica subsp. enterica serovar Poona]|nr:hypothetical protein [Salmonella enterica subsp. enterica serovar Poona]
MLTLTISKHEKITARTTKEHLQVPVNTCLFQGAVDPVFFEGIMTTIALILFGFIVVYAVVIFVAFLADSFFRKNG